MAVAGPVFVRADSIFSPLGLGTTANFDAVASGLSGVAEYPSLFGLEGPFQAACFDQTALVQDGDRHSRPGFSRFEQMLWEVIRSMVLPEGISHEDPETLFMIASAKGNIGSLGSNALQPESVADASLYASARKLAETLGCPNPPLVVSHACISGLLAVIQGIIQLHMGRYRHAVIAAADEMSAFILSGFASLQALSPEPCRPFDAHRRGINLGEGAAALVISLDPPQSNLPGPIIGVHAGAVTNDANHISGPSRTGHELSVAMTRAMDAAGIGPAQVDLVSLHGTATVYNDEMESRAIGLAGLSKTPVNSLKGNYGHTLGASGLIESVLTIESLRRDIILPVKGFQEPGISSPLHIFAESAVRPLHHALKTASGFGGCNAATVFSKFNNNEPVQQG